MSRAPQVLVTITPEGGLAIELPGQQATRRQVLLREGDAGVTLLRILKAQQDHRVELGLDGAPTGAQVNHWERHNIWPDSRCRFCLAEGRAKKSTGEIAADSPKKRVLVYKTPDGVEVRRIKAGATGLGLKLETKIQAPEEIGL
jgi:hypothetical protein